ncbi:MAG: hypothetical protein ABFC34_15350 [Methanobacterium sp.]
MISYDKSSKEMLEDKFDYELWLLDLLSNEKIFSMNLKLDEVYVKNYESDINRTVYLSGKIGGDRVKRTLLHELMPLTFVSCYKLLDMIFEWILIMNNELPRYNTFQNKINRIETLDPKLDYPPLLERYPDIKDHLFQLYKNLKNFRNEIVHHHKFNIDDDNTPKLIITTNKDTMTVKQDQLSFFVSIIVTIAKILTGQNKILDETKIDHIRYYFDQIQNLHQYSLYELKKPLLIDVKWVLDIIDNKSIANLDFIKEKLKNYEAFIEQEVTFNLLIIGTDGNRFINAWYFSAQDLSDISSSDVELTSYDDKLVAHEDLELLFPLKKLEDFFDIEWKKT